jgi:hypothetical protein
MDKKRGEGLKTRRNGGERRRTKKKTMRPRAGKPVEREKKTTQGDTQR